MKKAAVPRESVKNVIDTVFQVIVNRGLGDNSRTIGDSNP